MGKSLHGFSIVLMGCFTFQCDAQEIKNAFVKGGVVNKRTLQPVNDIPVTIPYLKMLSVTDGNGQFSFGPVPFGSYSIIVGEHTGQTDTFRIWVNEDTVTLAGFRIAGDGYVTAAHQIPVIMLDEADINDNDNEGGRQAGVSSLLTASRDPFLSTAGLIAGQYGFRMRGYSSSATVIQINGAPVNDMATGAASRSLWSGLNDVFRNRSSTYGLAPSEYMYGGAGGTVCFDVTAAGQRRQTKISYTRTNRQYTNSAQLSHHTGLLQNGWAFSVSGSGSRAKEGYIEGTGYEGYSYYAAVSKRLNAAGIIDLTAFGAYSQRGKAAPATEEANELAGSNYYNPNWGYQNGIKRNARIATVFMPVFLLSYEYKPSDKVRWHTVAGYQSGKNTGSGLDWYNAADPRPDYYRNLPGYYTYGNQQNEYNAALNRQLFTTNPQISWVNLYAANAINKRPVPLPDGTNSMDSGRRSLYVLGSDVDEVKKLFFNTSFTAVLQEQLTLNGGLTLMQQETESYRRLEDLLGGDYFLNVNAFTERNYGLSGNDLFNQNDINHPNRVLVKGDKYCYDYIIRMRQATLWQQLSFVSDNADLFIAAHAGFHTFQREGLYRNGLYAAGNESFGKGAKQQFSIYGLKGGLTWKLNGRHYLFLNGGLSAAPPAVEHTYFAARVRNTTVDQPQEQMTYSAEAGYLIHAPNINARFSGYVTDVRDEVNVQRFYYEGSGSANNFVDYMMQHMDTRFIGTELAVDYKISSGCTVTGLVALGQAFYTNNPLVSIRGENVADTGAAGVHPDVKTKGYYLSNGPQHVYSLGCNYRSGNWHLNINGSYADHIYVAIASPRRTADAVDLITPGSAQWHAILDQEKLPGAFVMNMNAGKTIGLSRLDKRLPRTAFLYISAGIGNLLDNRNMRTGGFENLRYDYAGGEPNRFAAKYFYAYGRNFYINMSLKF